MQIVIEIEDVMYALIMSQEPKEKEYWLYRVKHGTPLPEHHGRLIDADAVIEWLKDNDIVKMSYQENNAREDMLKSVPTIIEATEERE